MVIKNTLLRFITVGSVDDGKSTLIGRLLYDSKAILDDQLADINSISDKKGSDNIDLALFTDGLKDEREQGITIDVAYRYFTTPKRKFIIADTPGHIQYTRNMVTGASTANLALIIIDARHGLIEQTKRHAIITSILLIENIIVCVNKMDLVEYSQIIFDTIVNEFKDFSSKLNMPKIQFIPISALKGDNVVLKSKKINWYQGNSLLDALETTSIDFNNTTTDARFPVQTVLRSQIDDYRGYAGRVANGVFNVGDPITILPSGFTSVIKSIDIFNKTIKQAFTSMSVSISLEDSIDISRGDMIVKTNNKSKVTKDFTATLVWLDNDDAKPSTKYIIRHTSNEQMAIIKGIDYKINVNTLEKNRNNKVLNMNDICNVKICTGKPLMIDTYKQNKITGSFILIDKNSNKTVAAGMIL
ncbi:MAG: sulfate adenylyltransferase subunit 1 [Polaribacter sp.]|jgi:sulfate adenylyltransferase subunit 1|tara:strand:- start:120 stop:1364 length:1245 start_codon:yes stop_codon:yes gene_type:complete